MIAKKIKSVNLKDIKPPTMTKSMQRLKQVYTMEAYKPTNEDRHFFFFPKVELCYIIFRWLCNIDCINGTEL